jgi:hypothetical protein
MKIKVKQESQFATVRILKWFEVSNWFGKAKSCMNFNPVFLVEKAQT